jgi:Flp pilus assembly protein TadB
MEFAGGIIIAAGIACMVLVVAVWLWPVALIVFGAGLIGISALFSWLSRNGDK